MFPEAAFFASMNSDLLLYPMPILSFRNRPPAFSILPGSGNVRWPDGVVSPSFIGAMRMASLMVRPTVVSFLDVMLRDTERNLRVEEVRLNDSWAGKKRDGLDLSPFSSTLLLAVKGAAGWVYNPPGGYAFQPGDTLVVMTTPEEREKLENEFGKSV